jgi:hypothetical protein
MILVEAVAELRPASRAARDTRAATTKQPITQTLVLTATPTRQSSQRWSRRRSEGT